MAQSSFGSGSLKSLMLLRSFPCEVCRLAVKHRDARLRTAMRNAPAKLAMPRPVAVRAKETHDVWLVVVVVMSGGILAATRAAKLRRKQPAINGR